MCWTDSGSLRKRRSSKLRKIGLEGKSTERTPPFSPPSPHPKTVGCGKGRSWCSRASELGQRKGTENQRNYFHPPLSTPPHGGRREGRGSGGSRDRNHLRENVSDTSRLTDIMIDFRKRQRMKWVTLHRTPPPCMTFCIRVASCPKNNSRLFALLP